MEEDLVSSDSISETGSIVRSKEVSVTEAPIVKGSHQASIGSVPVTEVPVAKKDSQAAVENTLGREKLFSSLKRPLNNIGTWLGFCVAIALAPIMSGWLVSGVVRQPYDLKGTLSHGELLAISIALMGEALRYLLTNPNVNNAFKSSVGVGCTLSLIGSATILGALSIDRLNVDADYVMHSSFFFFTCTLIIGCICKWTER